MLFDLVLALPNLSIFVRMMLSYLFYPISGPWQDEDAFFRDYAASHKKLSELGFSPSSSKTIQKDGSILAQSAVGVAVAAAVVILSYVYEVRKGMK